MQYKFKYTCLYKLPFLLIYQYNKAVFTYHSKHITMSYLKKIFIQVFCKVKHNFSFSYLS